MYFSHGTLILVLCVMINLCADLNYALPKWLEVGCVLIAGKETGLTSHCQHKATEWGKSLDECKALLPQLNANTINYSNSGQCNVKACADEDEAIRSLQPFQMQVVSWKVGRLGFTSFTVEV